MAPKKIKKVKKHVTLRCEQAGFICEKKTGLPAGCAPWYGHEQEHGGKLKKRVDSWLNSNKLPGSPSLPHYVPKKANHPQTSPATLS